jgi:predicted TIM-barrel fold metal-dependent hydrolase
MHMDRREFLGTVSIGAGAMLASSATPRGEQAAPDWGGPVLDTHLHLRTGVDANYVHMQGCGVTHAVLRAREGAAEQVRAMQAKYPGRFVWTASVDAAKPDAEALLTRAIKEGGAIGFGEIKSHVEADGPELQRLYALAAELDVSIMVHFQEVPHFEGEGVWATGFKRFEAMLKKFPKTRFIGHADAFWANVSADYANEIDYPSGPIVRGGVTDKLLGDYGNLFGDLSANSGNNALSRDAAFTRDFLARHQDKLFFGSDCSCADGRGAGVAQANNPRASRLAGKCVARETLGLLQRSTTPAAFRKLAWGNAARLFTVTA